MPILSRLLESRSIENPAVPLTSNAYVELLGGTPTHAGVSVNESSASTLSAWHRGVSLIAGVSAGVPLKAYKDNTREEAPARVLKNPTEELTSFEFWEWCYTSLINWGNFYALKMYDSQHRLEWLEPLHPSWVKVTKVRLTRGGRATKIFEVRMPNFEPLRLTSSDIFHIPGLSYDGTVGSSVVQLARQSLGMAIAAEEYGGRFFGSGSMMSGLLTTDQVLNQDSANALKKSWQEKIGGISKAHQVAILDRGAKFQPVSIPPNDAQFIESRKFQTTEIARWLGVTPHLLFDLEKSTSWGTGIEQQSIGWVVYDLSRWLIRVEQRVTKEATPPGTYAKYKVQGLMRGDSAARAQYYNIMRQIGGLNADEIRDLEELPPIPDGSGQTYLQPMNMSPLGDFTNEPDDSDAVK